MKYYYAPLIETDGGATEIDDAQVVLAEDYDRLRDTLKELTAAVESECRHDTVLRKSLSPYCEAARLALEAKDA